MQFPMRLAAHLIRHAHAYDVIDASTGDAWVWASLGRPGSSRRTALVTRSHGLEHTAVRTFRAESAAAGERVRRRYSLYHGGFRLWEVERSLILADHSILLNQTDLAIVRNELRVPASRSSIVAHGVRDELFLEPVENTNAETIGLAFIGAWSQRKGNSSLVRVFTALRDAGIDATLSILGAKGPVLAAFPDRVRNWVTVVPSFDHKELPNLLRGKHMLLALSRTEGFQLALVEGMAAALAPISTFAGAAGEVIDAGRNGVLLPYGDDGSFIAAIVALAQDRAALTSMRKRARETAARYTWTEIAKQTMGVYDSARAVRARRSC
jgi:glycosyltransferase involved in cell wall biosynthesis